MISPTAFTLLTALLAASLIANLFLYYIARRAHWRWLYQVEQTAFWKQRTFQRSFERDQLEVAARELQAQLLRVAESAGERATANPRHSADSPSWRDESNGGIAWQ